MPYKFVDERTHVNPKTGKMCTLQEYETAGGKLRAIPSVKHKWFNTPVDEIRVGGQIIKDIEPYKPMAVDKNSGQRPIISGRRQHREFLRNNGYIEIGNSYVKPQREELSKSERVADIRKAMNDF